ncbi:hypothetical protein CRG98_015827 [Punica granatum]|uniref:Non-haem dioxygenase N-terminal domain-containing protein n=1 Tax=Punica granatum TaxID=22663 RepID=A0A2I0K6V3_PUNGR|nr:hypothetical protein CRG98_015827 [Punica granatum]
MATPKVSTVKTLVEKPGLTHIPPTYAFQTRSASDQEIPSNEAAGEPEGPIPIVDFSLLTSGTPDQRSTIIQDLRNICQDWGCFMVINHGVDESLLNKILDGCREFFDLEDKEEKKEYEGKKILDTICYGTSTDGPPSEALFWRDYLRVRVHPEFHSPRKPAGFSEVLAAFSEGVRGVNGINGLQLQRKGKWINANIISGAFFVQIDDHLEKAQTTPIGERALTTQFGGVGWQKLRHLPPEIERTPKLEILSILAGEATTLSITPNCGRWRPLPDQDCRRLLWHRFRRN